MSVDGRVLLSSPVRALWCNVITPRAYKENGVAKGDPTFDATFVLTPEQLAEVLKVAKAVANEQWPGKALKELKLPFKKAEVAIAIAIEKKKDSSIYTPGTYLLEARTKKQPILSWLEGGKVVEQRIENAAVVKQKFYHGCWTVPRLNFAIKTKNGDGIKAYLDNLFWYKDGEKIGGISSAEMFKGYIGSVSTEDPTGSSTDLDDEIPF